MYINIVFKSISIIKKDDKKGLIEENELFVIFIVRVGLTWERRAIKDLINDYKSSMMLDIILITILQEDWIDSVICLSRDELSLK